MEFNLEMLTAGSLGIGAVIFLIVNIRKLMNEISDVIVHAKFILKKFEKDEDIKLLVKELDEVLELLATIITRFGMLKTAKRLRGLI